MTKKGSPRPPITAPTWPLPELPGLTTECLEAMARDVGYTRRRARGIPADVLLEAVLEAAAQGTPSANDLAARIAKSTGHQVSRQAVSERLHTPAVQLLAQLLARVFTTQLSRPETGPLAQPSWVKRCLLQDSTIVALPVRLFAGFSGVANGAQRTCHARIQCVYDLLAGGFVDFVIDPYSKNDLTAAPELELRAGDLVLRDRGYLSYAEVQRHLAAGAHCIYRHKFDATYLDPLTGQPLDLTAQLERTGTLDQEVCLNNPERTRVRLVALPVPEEVANRRQQKLKQETKGHRPSAALLHQQRWTIFLTTIPATLAPIATLIALYALRWRIEIIFKTWKSSLSFAVIHQVSEAQLRIFLTARMIRATVCAQFIYQPASSWLRRHAQKLLSLLKLFRYLAQNPEQIPVLLAALAQPTISAAIMATLARYCCYDRRRRRNFEQQWQDLKETFFAFQTAHANAPQQPATSPLA